MYIILAYDVDQKRCKKYFKLCSKYLFHKQNSLFEGAITLSKLNELNNFLNRLIKDNDQITIYKMNSSRNFIKEEIGFNKDLFIAT